MEELETKKREHEEEDKSSTKKLKTEEVKQGNKEEIIKLNVGGVEFQITKNNLVKEKDSMLATMFAGRMLPSQTENGAYFIDRDPTHFQTVLNYLRYGDKVVLPTSRDARAEILVEADYYGLRGLMLLLGSSSEREKEMGESNLEMKREENMMRKQFMEKVPENPYHYLIDVFEHQSTFVFENYDPIIPVIMQQNRLVKEGNTSVVKDLDTFEEKFYKMLPALKKLDWDHLFCAGGSVVSALLDKEKEFQSSDIDLFLYGLSKEEAMKKIKSVYETLKKEYEDVLIVRTKRTLTFACGYPRRHLQIILRLYETPAEILLGFDLDCVAAGYNGKRVYCLPRARRAINQRINIADPSRQTFRTTSYEYRLWKYSKRGFAVGIPGFRRSHVNSELYAKEFGQLSGLAKLLFLEERDKYRDMLKNKFKRESWQERNQYKLQEDEYVAPDSYSLFELDVQQHVQDYNNKVLLPYSPVTDFENLLLRLRSVLRPPPTRLRFIFGTKWEVIEKKQEFLKRAKKDHRITTATDIDVPESIEFIGSLKEYVESLPEVEDNWYKDAMLYSLSQN